MEGSDKIVRIIFETIISGNYEITVSGIPGQSVPNQYTEFLKNPLRLLRTLEVFMEGHVGI